MINRRMARARSWRSGAKRQLGESELISRPEKQGIGPAYVDGMKAALETDAAFIATMDADLSHDPQDLPRLRAACLTLIWCSVRVTSRAGRLKDGHATGKC